jgi:hypothetical protein
MTQQVTAEAVETWVQWQGGRKALLSGDDAPCLSAGLGGSLRDQHWRPEELLIGAVELGVMLRFLALAEGEGLQLVSYQSSALGRFRGHAEEGCQLIDLIVRPRVSVTSEDEVVLAERLFALLTREPPDAGLLRVTPRVQPCVQLHSLAPELSLPH